jgi:3-hydroxyacyl-[acyl-carrier-protein] dehydratase
MNAESIEQLIPHRPPMRLVDQVVSREEAKIVCRKTFGEDDFFVQGHFPGNPLVPGVIQCECCLQAGAILLSGRGQAGEQTGAAQAGVVPVATRMDSVKFKRMVRPGDTVDIHVTLNDQVSNAFYMTGKMLLGGKLTARLDFACSLTDAGAASDQAATVPSGGQQEPSGGQQEPSGGQQGEAQA